MTKKLLFVITQPVVGGAQKYVFDLASYFSQKSGYDVLVAMGGSAEGDLFKKLDLAKIKTHHLKFLGREIKISDDFLAFFEILKLFKQEQPDIIHLNSSKVGLIGALAGWYYGLGHNYKPKIIFTAHGWRFKENRPGWVQSAAVFLAWFSSKFIDRIICVSQDDFNQALKYRIAPIRKLQIIHNAVTDTKFLTQKNALAQISKIMGREIPNDAVLLVNFGRLYATKGLNYLIESVKELRAKLSNKEIFLVIFGDGPEQENLKSQISNLPVRQAGLKLQDCIFLVGDKSEVSQYLTAFDAMVLSSTKEGFPYAILEAGLAGVPVISTNVGGVGEVINDGETGILVKPKDSKELAEAMENLIKDTAQAEKMSATLKKLILKKFDFETMASKTEWVYKV